MNEQLFVRCDDCEGTGRVNKEGTLWGDGHKCPNCNGKGRIAITPTEPDSEFVLQYDKKDECYVMDRDVDHFLDHVTLEEVLCRMRRTSYMQGVYKIYGAEFKIRLETDGDAAQMNRAKLFISHAIQSYIEALTLAAKPIITKADEDAFYDHLADMHDDGFSQSRQ